MVFLVRNKIASSTKQRKILKCVRAHPRRKNKDAPRVGHPEFHPPWVGNAGGELTGKAI
jgi:hypothetical protein